MPDKIQNSYHWWIITAIWWVSSKIIFTTVPITLNVTCLGAKSSWSETTPMSSVLCFWQKHCWRATWHLSTFLNSAIMSNIMNSEKTLWSHIKISFRELLQLKCHMRTARAWRFSGGIKQQAFPFLNWHSS